MMRIIQIVCVLAVTGNLWGFHRDFDRPWLNGPLMVGESGHFLQHANGVPFFYLADTAWALFDKLTHQEVNQYFSDRVTKKFNVAMAALVMGFTQSHINGNRANGVPPFHTTPAGVPDPTRPIVHPGTNDDYWDFVDYVLDRAEKRGIYVAMLPMWGALFSGAGHGYSGPALVPSTAVASAYGTFLGQRFGGRKNLIWMIGGDRPGSGNEGLLWAALANAIKQNTQNQLMSFHPNGERSSSSWFHQASWLDFHSRQTGHNMRWNQRSFTLAEADYNLTPPKPTQDGESPYEDQSTFSNRTVRFDECDVRIAAYWSVFAGSFGHTYGQEAVWLFYNQGDPPPPFNINPNVFWPTAMQAPGAGQMQHLRGLMEGWPVAGRRPDQSLLSRPLSAQPARATIGANNRFGLVFTPEGADLRIDLSQLSGSTVRAWRYDTTTGQATLLGDYSTTLTDQLFRRPSGAAVWRCRDWVLALADVSAGLGPPGQ